MSFDIKGHMAYRGDETDPLQVMINEQRARRRAVLVGVVMLFLPSLLPWNYLRSKPAPRPASAPLAVTTPKMTASEVEQVLQHAKASEPVRDHRCARGRDGWDYVCAYRTVARGTVLKVGVRVGANTIVQASSPYPYEQPLPPPAPLDNGR